MDLGQYLPVWSVLPFVGMLLSIALIPLVNGHWWERHMWRISLFWSLAFLLPLWVRFGGWMAVTKVLEVYLLDYMPFIILLLGLFAVSGGIVIRGVLHGTPGVNAVLLLTGTLLASWIGTTGASMLLIRPVIRANEWRRHKVHIFVFFIFLISNIGGALTPLGDPPLFLGFLRGVPFFWTMRLLAPMGFNVVILLALYFLIDTYYYRREGFAVSSEGVSPVHYLTGTDNHNHEVSAVSPEEGTETGKALRVKGLQNLIFLAMIVGAVILSGFLSRSPVFVNQATGEFYGVTLLHHGEHKMVFPYVNLIRDLTILVAAYLSVRFTAPSLRRENRFSWGPLQEVAVLFAGIFMTMVPALAILHARGAELGLSTSAHFFWATGVLSSFLDNAPTYLVFMTTAASLGADAGVHTLVGIIDPRMLAAVSCGAVFMGANSYIGNAPNFMVRAIAEENHIKMPSFLGYMGWSIAILIPLFLLDTLLFFS